MNKLKYLIVGIFVVLFLVGQVGRVKILGNLSINIIDIYVLLISSIALYKYKKIKELKSASLLVIATFWIINTISLLIYSLINPEGSFLVSFLYSLRLISYWGLFYILSLYPDLSARVRSTMLLCGAGVVGLGFLQYFFYPNLRNLFYLGWDEHLFRMFSVFLDPNFAGSFFAIFILFLNIFIFQKKDKEKILLYVGLSLLTLVALYLTYSRTAIIMLGVGMLSFLTLYGKKKYAFFVIVLLLIGFLLFSNRNIEGLNPFRIASSQARIETASNGIKIFIKYPLLGVGFNSLRYEQIRLGLRSGEVAKVSHADAGVDNSFIFLLATSGVIGSALYLFFLREVASYSLYRTNRLEKAVALSIGMAWMVGSLFINLLFYTPILLFIIGYFGTIRSKKP